MELGYYGRVEGGVISLPKVMREDFKKAFEGQDFYVVARPIKTRMSPGKRMYYFHVLKNFLVPFFIDIDPIGNGNYCEKKLHKELKQKFLDEGVEFSDLTEEEMSNYLEKINLLSIEIFGQPLPEPKKYNEMTHSR